MFPNCWDGKNLETAKPGENTHMAFRDEHTQLCPDTHPQRIPQLFTEVNYQIEKYSKHKGVKRSDFLLATGDDKGWGTHVDYISGWQQDTLEAALNTCVNTDQNNPNCSFYQFRGDIPASNNGKPPGSTTYFKPRPIEEVTSISKLLVAGKEVAMSGFPAAPCIWGAAAHKPPPPLLNKRGVLNTTQCPPKPKPKPKPTPATKPTPVPAPTPPPPPTPPQPAFSCTFEKGVDYAGHDLKSATATNTTECCSICAVTPGCTAWTLQGVGCYLKDSDAGRRTWGSTSGKCTHNTSQARV
jgi:hypothetical protein